MGERARNGEAYNHEVTDEWHDELVAKLKAVKGKFMLCGYANPLYDAQSWERVDWDYWCSAGRTNQKKGTSPTRVESVWINYEQPSKVTDIFKELYNETV